MVPLDTPRSRALPARLSALAATRSHLAAALCGLLAACGFPPLALWPATLLAVAALVWLITRAPRPRAAFGLGWAFGFTHFALTNNWIATAFTYQAQMPAALGWVAVIGLAAFLALYPAMAAAGAAFVAGRRGLVTTGLALAALWVLTEWLRSWVFTGYAWAPLGLSLLGGWDRPGLAALLPWLGTYGLSGLVVALGTGLAALAAQGRRLRLAVATLLLAAGMYWPSPPAAPGAVAYSLVQPNLRQEEIDDPAKFEGQFGTIAALTSPRRDEGLRLVLWPESAVPDFLRDGYPQIYYDRMTAGGDPRYARWRIGQTIGAGSLLLTGAVDLEVQNGRAVGAYNSVTALTHDGQFAGSYAKAHLVPGGEYLPLRSILAPLGLSRLVAGTLDFIPGPGPQTLDLGPWGRAGIQICYEIVFSGQVVDRANRPDYLFNPSNDGWFGAWGPPQHLAQARMRAIEEGLPVLRATTTGISAVIDARGVVREHIGRGRAARVDGWVPPALPATLFARLGNALPLGLAAALLAALLLAMRRRRA